MGTFLCCNTMPVVFAAKMVRDLLVGQALLVQRIYPLLPANDAKVLDQQLVHVLVGDAP